MLSDEERLVGARSIAVLGGLLVISVILGVVIYLRQTPTASGDIARRPLTTDEFHQRIAGGCNRMDIASRGLLRDTAIAKVGPKLRKFGKAVQEMLVTSRGLQVPKDQEEDFAHYISLLDDLHRATRSALLKDLPDKIEPLAEVIEDVAKEKLKVFDAATDAGLPRTCWLGMRSDAQELLLFARGNLACAKVSQSLDKKLPKGVPTTPAELELVYRESAAHARRLARMLPDAVPSGLPEHSVADVARSFERYAEVFQDALTATQNFDVNSLDAAIERIDPVQKELERSARAAGLPVCAAAA